MKGNSTALATHVKAPAPVTAKIPKLEQPVPATLYTSLSEAYYLWRSLESGSKR